MLYDLKHSRIGVMIRVVFIRHLIQIQVRYMKMIFYLIFYYALSVFKLLVPHQCYLILFTA